MKMPVSSSVRDQGNVLLVTLMITAVLGVILASYMILTQTEHVSVARSQTWNSAIVVSEAGAEDGLQMINRNVGSVNSAEELTTWTNFASGDGFDVDGRVYHVQRRIGDGYYDVWITNQALPLGPSVYATGTVPWKSAYASAPQSFFGAIAPVPGVSTPETLVRNVDIRTKYDPLWDVAMAALLTIDMHGFRITTDSFDSSDPKYSDFDDALGFGYYPFGELDKTKANGDVVSNTNIIDSVDVGNAKIKGTVQTGPGTNTCDIGANGSVGDRPWVEGGSLGIQTNHLKTDFNVAFLTVQMPSSALWLPPGLSDQNLTIDGKTYGYALMHDGDYTLPGLNKSLYVGTNAHVRLRITGNVSLTGTDEIRLSPVGSKLEIYMTGTSFAVGGNGINNLTRNSLNFLYYGLPSNTYISYGGNGNFVGAVYAPQADYYLGGGGSDTFDFIGASVTKTVTMNGHFNFHYDEALRVKGPGKGFIPTNWAEK